MEPKQKISGVLNSFPFPGIPAIIDGSGAIALVESSITQGGFFYAAIPSSKMISLFRDLISIEKRNLWDDDITYLETESARCAATACEGFALTGGRVSSFISGDDLVSVKDILFTISGKRLPIVFNVGSCALTSQSSSFYTGHDDVMAVNDCGWGMLFAKNPQEAADFALIARKTSEDSFIPFLNIQDGFLTTHSNEKVILPEPQLMKAFLCKPEVKLVNLFNPHNPVMTGVVQNKESYMKGKIAQRDYYEKLPTTLKTAMDEFYKLTGRKYDFVEEYMLEDAEYAIVGMGTGIANAMTSCDWMRKNMDIKIGVLNVSVFRPFPKNEIVQALSKVKAFTVIERIDNPLACDNPLTTEIKASFTDAFIEENVKRIPKIFSCTYGLGGMETKASHYSSIVKNMVEKGKRNYAIGVEHSYSIENCYEPDIISEDSMFI